MNSNLCHLLWEATLFKGRSMLKLNKKRKNIPKTSAVPENINKMSSVTRFILHIYHDLENILANLLYILLT